MEEQSMPKIVVNPRLRPVGENIKDALKLIYRHWAPLLVAQAIVFFVTIFVVALAIFIFLAPVVFGIIKGMEGRELVRFVFSGYFWIGLAVIFIPVMITGTWGSAAMISALGYRQEGMAPVGYVLKKGFQLLPPFLVLTILASLAYMGGWFLLVFPAVIICLGLSLAWYLCVLEDVSIFQAIGTSWRITKGYKWSIFGRLLLLMVMVWGVTIALAMVGMVPIMGMLAVPVQFALNFVIAPYALAYFYCIYEDIRSIRQDVYPMKGGIAVLMIVCWIVGAAACSGVVMLAVYLIQRYVL